MLGEGKKVQGTGKIVLLVLGIIYQEYFHLLFLMPPKTAARQFQPTKGVESTEVGRLSLIIYVLLCIYFANFQPLVLVASALFVVPSAEIVLCMH